MCSIEAHNIDQSDESTCVDVVVQLELIHDQLPLAVPCYDLLPVTEFAVVRISELRALPAPLS